MFSGLKRVKVIAVALICMSAPALSQTSTTDSFDVTMTIEETCQINSATNMGFGSVGILSNDTATSTITVQCTNGTNYDIGLGVGLGTGATVTSRFMTGGTLSETVEYSLYQDSGHTTVWGETIGTDTVASTGDGNTQDHTVYGRVATQATPAADTYSDTITVTLTY